MCMKTGPKSGAHNFIANIASRPEMCHAHRLLIFLCARPLSRSADLHSFYFLLSLGAQTFVDYFDA